MNNIGLIAGRGQLPIMMAKAAREKGLQVIAAAHQGETDPALADFALHTLWVKVGQLNKIIDFLKSYQVCEAVMAGGLIKTDVFASFDPDARALSLISRLPNLNDDTVLRAMADEFQSEGIEIRPATYFTPEILVAKGILTRRPPTTDEMTDIRLGWQVAKAVGALDVGQCVVVGHRTILAVEAVEGTDEAIRRGGRLGRGSSAVVKVCKPTQDLRFDLPSIGPNTITVMQEVKATALAIEAEKTIIFDREKTIAAADMADLAIIALADE
ncbi:MAG: UDP-2,3-diacylglucosamine diphosphatase LpxI [Deltaproteobacteria bacterium]|nr:UDP-2,3-diacylglucosamine diphosphatase LpxI [Deltaproteobacteria bacterium]